MARIPSKEQVRVSQGRPISAGRSGRGRREAAPAPRETRDFEKVLIMVSWLTPVVVSIVDVLFVSFRRDPGVP
jgi:hypothetical protein